MLPKCDHAGYPGMWEGSREISGQKVLLREQIDSKGKGESLLIASDVSHPSGHNSSVINGGRNTLVGVT